MQIDPASAHSMELLARSGAAIAHAQEAMKQYNAALKRALDLLRRLDARCAELSQTRPHDTLGGPRSGASAADSSPGTAGTTG